MIAYIVVFFIINDNFNNSFAGKTYAKRSFEPSGEIRTHPSERRSFYYFHSFLCARGVVRAQMLLDDVVSVVEISSLSPVNCQLLIVVHELCE